MNAELRVEALEICRSCGAPLLDGIKRRFGGTEVSFCCRQCVGTFYQHAHIAV